ncbi:hypothetical protein [Streptomyces collinus]|uniref:hypothetical protein n=1 Tax=Streptomyces collinus TaxID=42684 RepID=UPI0029437DF0|nr:hypothetical protein [Streptomyces collinus]
MHWRLIGNALEGRRVLCPRAGPTGQRYLSMEVADGFTGRVLGVYGTEGRAAFDRFDYEPRAGARDLDAPHAPS